MGSRENPEALTVRIEKRNCVARLALSGELDVAGATELLEQVRTLERSGAEAMLIDLHELSFIDSAGLLALVQASSNASRGGRQLAVVGMNRRARKIIELTRTQDLLGVAQGLELLGRFGLQAVDA